MLVENKGKKLKFRFENFDPEYIWEINPEDPHLLSDDKYRTLLKDVFFYDPMNHDFDRERFKIDLINNREIRD